MSKDRKKPQTKRQTQRWLLMARIKSSLRRRFQKGYRGAVFSLGPHGSVTAASLGLPVLTGRKAMEAMAAPPPPQTGPGQGNQSIVLQNCLAVLTMDDPKNDLQGADIVIQNGKIAAIGKGLGGATGNRVIDCSTLYRYARVYNNASPQI